MIKPLKIIQTTTKHFIKTVDANLPSVLTYLGLFGWGVTTVLVAKETGPFLKALEDENLDTPELRRDRPWDTAKVVAENYWPAFLSGIASTGSIIFANHEGTKRLGAALVSAAAARKDLKELREEIVDKDGEKKLKQLQDRISQKHVDEDPPEEGKIISTGYGASLCRDSFSGQYFYTNYKQIYESVDMVNQRLYAGEWVPAEDFLYLLHVPDPSPEKSRYLGWEMTQLGDVLKIRLGETRAPNGEPCNELIYETPPKPQDMYYSFRG